MIDSIKFLAMMVMLYSILDAQTSITKVVATGKATVFADDKIAARDEAIIDATKKAIEKLGIDVDATTMVSQGALIDNTVVYQNKGFIHSYRILNETVKDDIYSVEIEAWITDHVPAGQDEKYVRNYSIVVFIETKVDNKAVEDNWLENKICDKLLSLQFEVYDRKNLLAMAEFNPQKFLVNDDSIRKTGKQLLAGTVVVGEMETAKSSEVEGIVFYRTRITLKAIDTLTDRLIAVYSPPAKGIKGGGLDQDGAANQSIKAAADIAIPEFIEALSIQMKRKERVITVEVGGIPDLNSYNMISRFLASQRWVKDFEAIRFEQGEKSSFNLKYGEKIGILAGAINRNRNFVVRQVGENGIQTYFRE